MPGVTSHTARLAPREFYSVKRSNSRDGGNVDGQRLLSGAWHRAQTISGPRGRAMRLPLKEHRRQA